MKYRDGSVYADIYELCEIFLRRGDLDTARAPETRRNDREGAAWRTRSLKEGYSTFDHCLLSLDIFRMKLKITGDIFLVADGSAVRDMRVVHSFFSFRDPPAELLLPLRMAAFLYCEKNSLDGINIALNIRLGEKEKVFEYYADTDLLRIEFSSVLAAAEARLNDVKHRAEVMIPSVRDTSVFPYGTLREGQDILIDLICRVKEKNQLGCLS